MRHVNENMRQREQRTIRTRKHLRMHRSRLETVKKEMNSPAVGAG